PPRPVAPPPPPPPPPPPSRVEPLPLPPLESQEPVFRPAPAPAPRPAAPPSGGGGSGGLPAEAAALSNVITAAEWPAVQRAVRTALDSQDATSIPWEGNGDAYGYVTVSSREPGSTPCVNLRVTNNIRDPIAVGFLRMCRTGRGWTVQD
ncbi:MAG TPA: hypothetical protein VEH84_11300, partial [Alphaproteobacteria bacterium]|nr:hypothetical protein [Alphaproteobacteria bacterium]